MPFLPLKEKPYTNVDSVGNPMAFEKFIDADKDDFLNNTKRKGLELFVETGSLYPIDGIFYSRNTNLAMFVTEGNLHMLQEDGTFANVTFGDKLSIGNIVSYADYGDVGYFANYSKILKWRYGEFTSAHIGDPEAPDNATFLGFLNQYLLALRAGTARFDFSETGEPDLWRGEFAVAESRPDNAVALFTAFDEIYIPGTSTTEHWSGTTDPTIPFQKSPGTLTERGTMSPYTVVQLDNSYMYLDSEKRVVRMSGRTPQVISNPFDNEFQSFRNVEQAYAINFNAEGDTKYIISFPVEQRTFVYDYKRDFWSEWTWTNPATRARESWIGRVGVYCEQWGKYLVGSRIDGKIYVVSKESYQDYNNEIATEMWTGRINWGTDKRKATMKMRIKLRRGTGDTWDVVPGEFSPEGTPKLFISYRDDGKGEWSADRMIDLGETNDTETEVVFRRLGTYRNRQWRFRIAGGPLTLVSAEEDFEVTE